MIGVGLVFDCVLVEAAMLVVFSELVNHGVVFGHLGGSLLSVETNTWDVVSDMAPLGSDCLCVPVPTGDDEASAIETGGCSSCHCSGSGLAMLASGAFEASVMYL